MVDLAIVDNDVVAGVGTQQTRGTCGSGVSAGDVVYQGDDKKWRRADASSPAVAPKANHPTGIALNNGANNQPLAIHLGGDLTVTAVLTPGTSYFLSPNPGKLAPRNDINAGNFVVLVGMAKSATVLMVDFVDPNVAI